MGWGLSAAVGLTDEGTQAPNEAVDQQQVGELLDAAGLPAGGTPLDWLPPIESGSASSELCEAIRGFQRVQGLVEDARVDVNGATWQRLLNLVAPGAEPLGGVPLLLAASDFTVVELPRSASGLPSLTYTVRGPVATLALPGIRFDLSIQGPLKVDWGATFPLACEIAPDLAALNAAVASGVARGIGGVALDQLCSRLKVESRAAIGSLFAAITLQVRPDGTPIIGGSIGDATGFESIAWDPVERALIYRTTKRILKPHPVIGGDVRVSGDIRLELRATATDQEFEASVVAAVVVAVAAVVVLLPVAEWAAVELVSGVGAGVREVLIRLGPALAP